MTKATKPTPSRAASARRSDDPNAVLMGLSAAIVSVSDGRPRVLAVHRRCATDALPFGTFDPVAHRTLEIGLREWVEQQTGLQLGYAEQLYTFGDRGRHLTRPGDGPRVLSIGYLALTHAALVKPAAQTVWRDWYGYFPWEDWRDSKPQILETAILPGLEAFAASGTDASQRERRRLRTQLCFGNGGINWDEEKVLERYELLYEAGLVAEAQRDRGGKSMSSVPLGQEMLFDHRRILATAMGRLRGKMKYRPVVFELMQAEFTLLELQRTVEALSGIRLHKQNFRRLVESQGLVEGTSRLSRGMGGRPAEQFRFRREVLRERPTPGLRPGSRVTGKRN